MSFLIKFYINIIKTFIQLIVTCSNSKIETPEQFVKSVQVNNKDTRTTSMTGAFIVNLEQISQIDSTVDFE